MLPSASYATKLNITTPVIVTYPLAAWQHFLQVDCVTLMELTTCVRRYSTVEYALSSSALEATHEKNLSAQQHPKKAQPWLQGPHGYEAWAGHYLRKTPLWPTRIKCVDLRHNSLMRARCREIGAEDRGHTFGMPQRPSTAMTRQVAAGVEVGRGL
jgi:hypothetical protein